MKRLIKINQQSLILELEGDPDSHCLPLRKLDYQAVDLPDWEHGAKLHTTILGDLVTYIGPTEDLKRAVCRHSTGSPIYVEFEWADLEPAGKEQSIT